MDDKHEEQTNKLKKALKASRENYRCQKIMKETAQESWQDLWDKYLQEQAKTVHIKELLIEVCADYSALESENKKLRRQSGD